MPYIHQAPHGFPVHNRTAHHVIGKKRFTAARRTKNKFIAVGTDTFLHGFIRNIDMNRLAGKPVSQA